MLKFHYFGTFFCYGNYYQEMHCSGTWGPVMPFLICIFSQLPSPSSSELSAPLTTFLKYTQPALSMSMSMFRVMNDNEGQINNHDWHF